jgi:8-oxo-dGTP diphosphatase
MEIKSGYYRVSIKALILDETRTKFLVAQEDNGLWGLPGGGWDWGETYDSCLKRELHEEMGLTVISVEKTPSYLVPAHMNKKKEIWITNVVFEVTVADLDFTPSNECVAIKFVTAENVRAMDTNQNVQLFADMFDPKNHVR